MNRKYVVVLIDGMADYPVPELGGKTPLEKARTSVIDKLVKESEIGMVKTVPEGFPPGSDVANMSVLGYDPGQYYTGRSPYEALSMGIELEDKDISLRCNLVNLSKEEIYENKFMKDYSAGEITTEEARELIEECQKKLGSDSFSFHSGVSYRHVVIWKNGEKDIKLTPPHDITDRRITEYLPVGNNTKELISLMEKSNQILSEHEVNIKRRKKGLPEANSIWFWGEGTKPQLDKFADKFSVKGSVISAVDLIKGLGKASGLKTVDVPGATGRIDTNFTGKAEAVIDCLKNGDDFVFLHIEAADEAGHLSDIETKIKAIELVDELVLKYIMKEIKVFDEYAVMVLPDHYTPVSTGTHSSEPVPFMIYRNYKSKSYTDVFSEKEAEKTGNFIKEGYRLMDSFIDIKKL